MREGRESQYCALAYSVLAAKGGNRESERNQERVDTAQAPRHGNASQEWPGQDSGAGCSRGSATPFRRHLGVYLAFKSSSTIVISSSLSISKEPGLGVVLSIPCQRVKPGHIVRKSHLLHMP